MKQKWIFLVAAICLFASFSLGFFTHRQQWHRFMIKSEQRPDGRWRKVSSSFNLGVDAGNLEKLYDLPYLQGTKEATEFKGITQFKKDKAYSGINLVLSGHEQGAYLMDMEGNSLHHWSFDAKKLWPDYAKSWYHKINMSYWRRACLLENGDLIAIYTNIGMIKLDKNSNLIWSLENGAHHDCFVDEDGTIYTITLDTKSLADQGEELVLREDFISVISPDGKEISKLSLFEALKNSPYKSVLLSRFVPQELADMRNKIKEQRQFQFDVLHTNTIELLDGRFADQFAPFKKGNILVSFREAHTIAVIDLEQQTVVWALSNMWNFQHQPTVLDNGNLLVFNNNVWDKASSVMELNPLTHQVVWEYRGTEKQPFYTKTCGSNQRLPNNNTLISESDMGRAFEVTLDKEIVWEFVNPNRAGEKQDLVATLFEIVRMPPDFPLDWTK